MRVIVGVCVGVCVGVDVGVWVGVCVGVLVGVELGVRVGVSVGVCVGVDVGVWVGVWVGVLLGVDVGVCVGVRVGVLVGKITTMEPLAPVVPANRAPLISKAFGTAFSNGYVPAVVVGRMRKLQVIRVPSLVSCVGVDKLMRPTRAMLHGGTPGPVQPASVVQVC